jgi:hypothetical protein
MQRLLPLALLFLATSCNHNDCCGPEFQSGTLQINTATTGQPPAELTVIVDEASPRTVSPNGTLSIPAVDIGSHIVQLTLPTSCTLEGENPRTVNVTENAVTVVDFVVTC